MSTTDVLWTFLLGKRIGNAPPPMFLKFRSSEIFILSTIVIAVFTDMFLYAMVVPILPFALVDRAGVKEQDLQKWTSILLSVYGAALAIGSPISGILADRSSSRRAPLLGGLLTIGGATALLMLGRSLPVLLIGRILQGLSGSLVWTVGLALLTDTVQKERIGQAMGYVTAAFSAGALCGPLLGGVFYSGAGYYSVFVLGFAFVGIDILMRMLIVEKAIATQWCPKEVSVSGDSAHQGAGEEVKDSASAVNAQAPSEKSKVITTDPIPTFMGCKLPPMILLLRIPRLLASLFGCFVQATALAAFDGVLPAHVKNTFHWNSTGAGIIFLTLVLPTLTSPFFGYLSDRYGGRYLTTFGFLATIPFWVCLRFITSNTMGIKVLLCILLCGIGFGLTMGLVPLMAEIDHVVALEEKRHPGRLGKKGGAAQGFALFNAAYAIGIIVGPLWAGFIVESGGFGMVGWSLSILCAVAAVGTFCWTGGRILLKEGAGAGEDAV